MVKPNKTVRTSTLCQEMHMLKEFQLVKPNEGFLK